MPDLEEVWQIREEELYPGLFGPGGRGIFPLDQSVFARFGEVSVDPRWLSYGVWEFAPTDARRSWAYVTSGHSNPWDVDPADYEPGGLSGAGVEFLFETDVQGDWAIRVLQNMLAFDLLLGAGHFGDRPPFGLHDRVPLNAPLDGRAETQLRALTTLSPPGFPDEVALPSGRFQFLQFAGITEDEADFGRANGGVALMERLTEAGALPVTQVGRGSAL